MTGNETGKIYLANASDDVIHVTAAIPSPSPKSKIKGLFRFFGGGAEGASFHDDKQDAGDVNPEYKFRMDLKMKPHR